MVVPPHPRVIQLAQKKPILCSRAEKDRSKPPAVEVEIISDSLARRERAVNRYVDAPD